MEEMATTVDDLVQSTRGTHTAPLREPGKVTPADFPAGATEVPPEAFKGRVDITSIQLPGSITKIGARAFDGCCGLTGSLSLPGSIVTIGDSAFSGCSRLTGSIELPDTITTIGDHAFEGCRGLTGSLSLPGSIAAIGNHVFGGCRGLSGSLSLPGSVTTIGDSAFFGCSGLTGSLLLPGSLTTIENGAFQGCSGITGALSLPDAITTIGNRAFQGCSGLSGPLLLPDSLTTIDNGAFQYCGGLTGSLLLPNGITRIGNHGFDGCRGLTGQVLVPEGVTIGAKAFSNTELIVRHAYALDLSYRRPDENENYEHHRFRSPADYRPPAPPTPTMPGEGRFVCPQGGGGSNGEYGPKSALPPGLELERAKGVRSYIRYDGKTITSKRDMWMERVGGNFVDPETGKPLGWVAWHASWGNWYVHYQDGHSTYDIKATTTAHPTPGQYTTNAIVGVNPPPLFEYIVRRTPLSVPPAIDLAARDALVARCQELRQRGSQPFRPPVLLSYGTGQRVGLDAEGAGPGLALATVVAGALFAAGIECFAGAMVYSGENWEDEFMSRLDKTKYPDSAGNAVALVMLLDAAFYASKACLEETHTALQSSGVVLIPVRMQPELPSEAAQWPEHKASDDPAKRARRARVQKHLQSVNSWPPPPAALIDRVGQEEHVAALIRRIRAAVDDAARPPFALPHGSVRLDEPVRPLGASGGTSDVYAGTFTTRVQLARGKVRSACQAVAVKCFRNSAGVVVPPSVLEELEVGRNIQHINLVRTIGILVADASGPAGLLAGHALVLELLEGGTLHTALLRAPEANARAAPAWPDRLRWLSHVAAGMVALHQAGLVHRDLKCTNVLLTRDGSTAKVCDFGLANVTETVRSLTGHSTASARGSMAGTVGFKAPETYHTTTTRASDVFSFAMVVFQTCALHPPFAGTAEQRVVGMLTKQFDRAEHAGSRQVKRRVAKGEALSDVLDELEEDWIADNPLAERRPDCGSIEAAAPPKLRALMQRCWADAPAERPPSVDVCAELDRCRLATSQAVCGVKAAAEFEKMSLDLAEPEAKVDQ